MSRAWLPLLLLGLLAAAGAAAWAALDGRYTPVRRIEVTGELRYLPRAEVERRLAPLVGRSLLAVDLRQVRGRLAGSPWVAHVAVRRQWPDTLRVEVRERRAMARWAAGGLVDAAGRVFRPEPGPVPGGLPELAGPPGTATEVLGAWRRFGEVLAPAGVTLARVAVDRRRAWRLVTDAGVELVLGRREPQRALARYAAAAPVLAGMPRAPARVDLRYPNGLAVRWKEPPPAEGEP